MITSSALGSYSTSSTVDELVAQYRASERTTIRSVENKKTNLSARLSVLRELKTKLSTLNTTVEELAATGTDSKFATYTVSSTLSTVATASATSKAVQGTHSLLVTQLAKADTVLSSSFTSTGTTIADAEGAGTKQIQLTIGGTNTPLNVVINAGDSNSTVLSNIATAINASDAKVSASVVAVSSTMSKLVLTSESSGSANAIGLTDISGTLLDNIGLTDAVVAGRSASSGSTAGFSYTSVDSLDANFKLDGIDIIRGSNTVDDVLTGVTFELKGTQLATDNPVVLQVGGDKDEVKASVQEFITDYNEALKYLTAKMAVDPETHTREILAGDSTFALLRVNLRTIVTSAITSVTSGNPKLLSDIGIEAADDGTLSITDSDAFDEALSDISKISDLFNSSNGIAVQLESQLADFVSTTGIMQATQDSIEDNLDSIEDRITRFDERLEIKVARFRAEFLKLQEAMTKVSQQQQTLQSILSMYS